MEPYTAIHFEECPVNALINTLSEDTQGSERFLLDYLKTALENSPYKDN
jgi:hypothetical protein